MAERELAVAGPRCHQSLAGIGLPLRGSIVGVGPLVWAIIEAPANGWGSAVTIGALVGAVAALGGFVWWESRRTDPLFDVTLFANARFSAASGAIAAAFFGLFGFIFLITQYFQIVRGYGILDAGVATLPLAVVLGRCRRSPLS